MIPELTQALSSLDTATAITKTVLELDEPGKPNAALHGNLLNAILAAQQQVLQSQASANLLTARISQLETECLRLRQWDVEKLRHTRYEVGPAAFVYIANELTGDFATVTKWCSVCFEKAIKSQLQQHIVNPGMMVNLVCPNGCPKLVFTHYLERTKYAA